MIFKDNQTKMIKSSNKSEKFIIPVIAFFICWSIQLVLGMTVRNPLTAAVFIAAFFLEKRFGGFIHIKEEAVCGTAGLLIALAILAGSFGRVSGNFDSGLFKLLCALIIFVGGFFLGRLLTKTLKAVISVRAVEDALRGKDLKDDDKKVGDFSAQDINRGNSKAQGKFLSEVRVSKKAVFFVTFFLCMLFWLPYFLYEYPGIMTADSLVQYEQVVGIRPLSNHHPAVHTLCFAFFYNIGYGIWGDANKGIAFYTFFQMLFMACCCARLSQKVFEITGFGDTNEDKNEKRGTLSVWTLLSMAFFSLVPFNGVFAVTIWKDVPFAGIMMLFTICIYDLINLYGEGENNLFPYVLKYIALGIAFCLFRSNALYAYFLCIPFFLFFFRKRWKIMFPSVLSVIVIALFIKGPVMDRAGIEQSDFAESLCVPFQQVARVLVNDREISERDLLLIDAVIDRTYIHELYAPDFGDNIKELVRAGHPEVLEENKGQYLALWARLLFRYPVDYIGAWFDMVGGYVYPDVSYDVGNIDGVMGNDMGLASTPLIGGKAVIKTKEILIKLGSFVPLYGMLWCAGAYTWLLIFFVVIAFKNKKYRHMAIMAVIPLSVVTTLCIAAPLVDFRYAYGVVMTMPIYASLCAIIVTEKKRG